MIRAITYIWQTFFDHNTNTMSSTTTSSEGEVEDISDRLNNFAMALPQARKKKARKPRLQPEAILLLKGITLKTDVELKTLLYKTAILPPSNENFQKIVEYVKNGQEHGFGIQVLHIIRMVRNKDFEFKPSRSSSASDHRMILWHGTKKSCVPSIVTNGFAQPVNKHQMFGTGVYFADKASKSANYCDGTSVGKLGYMFLCDVKLGKVYKARNPHNDYTSPPPNFDTVKCVGKNIPDWSQNKEIGGAVLPSGPTKPNHRFDSYTVNFNEYVVYNPERIKPKWLVVVQFQARKVQ